MEEYGIIGPTITVFYSSSSTLILAIVCVVGCEFCYVAQFVLSCYFELQSKSLGRRLSAGVMVEGECVGTADDGERESILAIYEFSMNDSACGMKCRWG